MAGDSPARPTRPLPFRPLFFPELQGKMVIRQYGGNPPGKVDRGIPVTITDMTFDWPNAVTYAPGSDNWPLSWASDDSQWTSFGDGGGFGGTNSDGRTSWGIANITGDFGSEVGTNVYGGKDSTHGYSTAFDGKSYGILALGSTIYAWWGPGSGVTSYTETILVRSTDGGENWTKSSWDFIDDDADLIMPTICQFGQDYAWNTDGYVYHYFIRKDGSPGSLAIHDTGIDLARCLEADIWDNSLYEWWDGSGWTSTVANRAFVITGEVGWNCSVQYLQSLDKYILITEHSESLAGRLVFYQADNPQGPWTAFKSYNSGTEFGAGEIDPDVFFACFSSKWTSGLDSVLVYTGVGDNDLLGLVPVTFVD